MSLDSAVLGFAGVVILVSALLAHFVQPAWIWLTAVFAVNLIQASVTGFCPAAMVFRALGIRPGTTFR